MQLLSIETTPNPNSIKLNFDQSVDKPVTYTVDQLDTCHGYIRSILSVGGVQSIFVCANFITLNRDPRVDWKHILDAVNTALNEAPAHGDGTNSIDACDDRDEQRAVAAKVGQATIVVQTFKGVPIQVKVSDAAGEKRMALDARFSDTAQAIQAATGADYLKERYWADWGIRYGTAADVAAEVVEEISARFDTFTSERIFETASSGGTTNSIRELVAIASDLKSSDWSVRLRAVQELSEMDGTTDLLISALDDNHQQVRRLAAAALGASGDTAAVNSLSRVFLEDPFAGVRRTAGDALSDIGSVEAELSACNALSDENKLVRWRAARILADLGTDSALPYLKKALGDTQFEVNLEIECAIERIECGKESSLPMWKKIQESRAHTS
jgi:hypothetical protein